MRARDAVGLARANVGQVAGEKQQPGPIEADLQSSCPGWEFEQVNAAPNEPGDETREVKAEQVSDGGVAADGTQFTKLLE